MNNEEFFEQHLLFEFLHGEPNKVSLLYEGRSVVPGIDVILDKIIEMLQGQIEKTLDGTYPSSTFNYTEIPGLNLERTFIESINFSISLSVSEKPGSRGGIDATTFKYYGENTKIPIDIALTAEAPNEKEFKRVLYYSFGHELTHAYGMWQYMMKNKCDFLPSKFFKDTRYKNFRSDIFDQELEAAVKMVHYRLSRVEMNAYIAQLRQELLLKKDEIVDAKSALKAIKSTDSYKKNYLSLQRSVEGVRTYGHPYAGKKAQNSLIYVTNLISGKKFTNINQVIKYYENRWEQYKKDYMIKASKIAYDVYSGSHFMLDGGEI